MGGLSGEFWYYAAQIAEELRLISGAPPSQKKKPHPGIGPPESVACQRPCVIHLIDRWQCSLLLSLFRKTLASVRSARQPTCVRNRLLFVRPPPPSVSASLNSPLPCFAKAVPVSSTNTRFSSYLCFRAPPRGGQLVKKEDVWHSVGVQTQSVVFVRVALLVDSLLLCEPFPDPCLSSVIFPDFLGISFFPSFQCYPLILCCRTSLLTCSIHPGFMPPLTPPFVPL